MSDHIDPAPFLHVLPVIAAILQNIDILLISGRINTVKSHLLDFLIVFREMNVFKGRDYMKRLMLIALMSGMILGQAFADTSTMASGAINSSIGGTVAAVAVITLMSGLILGEAFAAQTAQQADAAVATLGTDKAAEAYRPGVLISEEALVTFFSVGLLGVQIFRICVGGRPGWENWKMTGAGD